MESITKLLNEYKYITPERRDYLLRFFSCIPDDLARHLVRGEVKKGQYILKWGAPCDAVYFMLKGKVTGEAYTSKGRGYSFMDFSKMHVLGDFELFYDFKEYTISVRAEEDCSILKLSSEQYKNWIRNDANALYLRLQNILTVLSFERMIDREYLQMSIKERLATLLKRFYEDGPREKNGSYTVSNTQVELADKIGANLRSVQRSIAALEEDNLVSLKRGKITISGEQYEALKNYTEE